MSRGLIQQATHAVRYFLLRRLPPCKQMSVLMSESLERPLTLRERMQLRLHLWICIWCVWYFEHLQILSAAVRARAAHDAELDSTTAIQLSLEARERIKRTLNSES
jgi:hypothetical protein